MVRRQQNEHHRLRWLALASDSCNEYEHNDGATSSSKLEMPRLDVHHFENMTVSEVQKELVQLGLAWKQQKQHRRRRQSEEQTSLEIISQIGNVSVISYNGFPSRTMQLSNQGSFEFQSPFERVLGCVANVEIRTNLQVATPSPSTTTLTKSYASDVLDNEIFCTIHLEGHADAILSQGLVVVLANYIQGFSADQLLAISPSQVADDLHLRQALSAGRNDGLANMMRLFQTQLRALLLKSSQQQPPQQPAESTITLETELPRQRTSHRLRNIATHWRNLVTSPLRFIYARTQSLFRNNNSKAPTVAVLLSGGVDSSVALALLRRQNYNCTAFYLKIWLEDELAHLGTCPWEDDYRTCQQVCEHLQVPLESISLQHEYKEKVMSYTLAEAQKGRTPNPDIMCNSRVKFGCFYDAIAERNFDYVASGHYAQVVDVPPSTSRSSSDKDAAAVSGTSTPRRMLLRAPDPVKDQSYFLCALSQEQLQRVLFPIGHLQKSHVRLLAEDFGLPNRNRPDSQGLCFLGKVKFDDFLQAYLGEERGDVVDAATGEILGHHRGVWYHTVGQRKGLGKVLDPLATSRGPWYVVAKHPLRRIVYCSNEYDEDIFARARSEFYVEDLHWIAGTPPLVNGATGRFDMKIRHGPRLVQGTLELVPENDAMSINNKVAEWTSGRIHLDNKDGGLAPGQFVAFYQDLECLGGGVISERHWAEFLSNQPSVATQPASTVTSL